MEFTMENIGGITVFKLEKKLDSLSAPKVEKELLPAIKETGKYLLNMSGMTHISSAGLRVLLMAAKKVKSTSSLMILCEVPETIQEVFDIAGFTALFVIKDTQQEALAELQS